MSEAVAIAEFVVRAIGKVLPAFLLSVALGVLIRALKLDGMIRRAVEARVGLAVVLATGVGAFSPLCSCTVIPVISGLLLSGVPLAPVMAFWVASPTMDPEMFALTVATLGWPLAVARLAATLVLSLGAGYLTLALTRAGFFRGEIMRESLLPARASAAAARVPLISGPVLQPVTIVSRLSAPRPSPTIAGASGPSTPAGACCGSSAAVSTSTTVVTSALLAKAAPGIAAGAVTPAPDVAPAPGASAAEPGSACCADAPAASSVRPISGGSDTPTSPCCGGSAPPPPPPSRAISEPASAGSCCGGSVVPVSAPTPPSGDLESCCGTPVSETAAWSLRERVGAVHWPTFGRDMARETWRLGRWLVLAFLLEAVMLRYVPQATVAGVLGEGSHFAVVLAALVGIPLYLNNVSALPIVSGLLAQGMQPGAAIAFLIAGPVTTVPAMSAVWGIVKPRVFALYLGIALAGAVVLGTLTNLILG